MNLYRNFGNLMEAWVNEGARRPYSEPAAGSHDEDPQTPGSHVEAAQRWESLDSGVETSSSDVSSPSPADNSEAPGGHCLAQASQSPPPSPGRAQGVPASLQQQVERALQRTGSQHLKEKLEPLTADTVLRRLPRASPASRRSESFEHRGSEVRTRTNARPARRRPASMIVNKLPSQRKLEDLSEEEGRELSPGLSYLEQVCRTLEEFARQQMNRPAAVGLHEHGDMEDPDGSLVDSLLPPADDVIVCSGHTLESGSAQASSSAPQRRKYCQRHFRQRSVSDANLATLHLRELNAASRGQQRLSTDDLLLKLTDDFQKQESKREEKSSTVSRHWTFKIGSLKRESSSQRESKGQQTQPSEKSSTRRRLSQLFRRNQRKTQPA
ncbi:uncharacterized protein LOC142900573 isoform X2 [Nelusetta ayraudi]|uniref:uncharacterized protein LOC142900573 isoform X2 n=1 Tax=Nelusetta ayraudi TaxID=303726 RepID=UPI003F6E9CA1